MWMPESGDMVFLHVDIPSPWIIKIMLNIYYILK